MTRVMIGYFIFRVILWQITINSDVTIILAETMSVNGSSSLSFSEENKIEILHMHNYFRSEANPPAANMKLMKWDAEAEKAAVQWAKNCTFKYGMPLEYDHMGQNLYIGDDTTGDRATFFWWNARENYNFSTHECNSDASCGFYTQLMWATSEHLGCGISACPQWNLITCYYKPPGNYKGVKPYEEGVPCSQCDNGGWCYQNLCVTIEECEYLGLKCTCPLQCQNGGVLDNERCRCNCKDGWDSTDCSKPCENSHPLCLKNPGFPSSLNCLQDARIKNIYCRAMCNQCILGLNESASLDVTTNIPENPNGVICQDGYVYKEDTYECVLPESVESGSGTESAPNGDSKKVILTDVSYNADFATDTPSSATFTTSSRFGLLISLTQFTVILLLM